jgi:hypothetical protein
VARAKIALSKKFGSFARTSGFEAETCRYQPLRTRRGYDIHHLLAGEVEDRQSTVMPKSLAAVPPVMASISSCGTPENCLLIHSRESGNEPSRCG